MSVAVSVRTADGATVVAAHSAVHIEATEVDIVNEATNEPINYYLSVEATGVDTARSPVFSGDFTWDGYIFPEAATYTIHLRKDSDDSSVANVQQVVS